jgi:hypothetical protein
VHALAVALVLLHGVVMRGPTKPVCEVGTPCLAPAAHTTLVFTCGARVTRATTDGAGRYAVRLPRGTCTVAVSPRPRIGSGIEPRRFTVRAPRRLDFSIDTGIR